MTVLQAGLVSLKTVPRLEPATILDWHLAHLNPALVTLMQLGGYAHIQVERAEGPYLYTKDGRRLLDLVSSYGALSHGHNHPRVVEAARWFDRQQAPDLLKEFPSPYAGALARNLAAVAPGSLDVSFLCNSGTEAVEGALKLAQRVFQGRRDRFVYARNSLHGKTLGTLSITGRDKYRAHVRRFEDWPMVPFGDLDALKEVFAQDERRRIAGLVLEPIQGEAGVVVPPAGYLAAAAELCGAHGALLILDEIQTALGRTGRLFRCEAEGVVPDILCIAKSLGGGVATIGATITRRDLHQRAYGRVNDCLVHTSTFGGRGRAAAIAVEALNVAVEEDFAGRARELGAELKDELEEVRGRHPKTIRAIRGEGLMLGVEFEPMRLRGIASPLGAAGVNKILRDYLPGIVGAELLHRHDILASFVISNPNVLRVYPALVATREDLAPVAPALDAVLSRGLPRVVAESIGGAVRRTGLRTLTGWLRNW